MFLSSIQLKNFRIHKDTLLSLSEKINYIVGGNGQGKTSILEAIYLLCTTKSLNANSDSELIRFNENEFELTCKFKDLTEDKVRIYYSLNESRKYYFINNKQVGRSSEVIGKFPVVILTPADHAITQGYPGDRRKFVDSVISQASETYLKILMDYNKTLRQRSSLLTQLKENRRKDIIEEFNAWTQKLIVTGSEIIKHRINFIQDFNRYIRESYSVIMDDNEIPEITYSYLDNYVGGEIEKKFESLLSEKRDEEFRRAVNLAGPHRDDFIFEVNGLNLRTFGSQGQHKTFQVVLRFAEFFYLKETAGKTPIFLLDDIFGELDANRAFKISEYLKKVGQAFITLTDFADFSFLKKDVEDLVIKLNRGEVAYA